MVLESIVNPLRAEQSPWQLFIVGFLYSSLGIFLSLWVFQDHASLVMVFLTTMAAIPLLYFTVKREEEKHLSIATEIGLLREHAKAFSFLMLMFLGAAVGYAVWYVALPEHIINGLYATQTQTIASLNQKVTGNVAQLNILTKIFLNNIKVMIFCIIFSFLYGSGAIFILMWNASVIGVALGNFFKSKLAEYAAILGFSQIASYFYAASLSILRYSIHGIPEILAYIVAGLAGGIISIAIIRHDFSTKNFERIILDASDLILLSIFILFVAAILEVFVTPIFF